MAPTSSPEHWEASDHIENLKKGLGAEGVCQHHDDLTRSQMWIIRRLDVTVKPARDAKEIFIQWMFRFPYAAALVLSVVGFYYCKSRGWIS